MYVKLQISIKGTYYETSSVNYENGVKESQYVFSLPSNELIQDTNGYDGYDYSYVISEEIIKNYKNGKEVFVLKCSVANYYDIDENLIICPENSNYPSVFEKYDIVEPYVFSSEGEIPLSTNADGTPKKFEVIGVDFSYSGVVWQELTVQEYVE